MRKEIAYGLGLIALFLGPMTFADEPTVPSGFEQLSGDIEQVVTVMVPDPKWIKAEVTGWEKRDGVWIKAVETTNAVIGRNGLAVVGEKKEGDGKTPAGKFKLRRAFGYLLDVETDLDYRQVTADDLWIDDPTSPDYNLWVKAPTTAQSFEKLHREDDLYKYAVVIEYNTDPVVPGAGSAIFMHIWRGPDQPTAGCIALAERKLVKLISWLNPQKNATMIITIANKTDEEKSATPPVESQPTGLEELDIIPK